MPLQEEMIEQGRFLFRWRGLLPLAMVALFLFGFAQSSHVEPEGLHWFDHPMQLVALSMSLLGLGIRAVTIGIIPKRTSGRGVRRQRAETLNTTSLYSLVRHPLYLGNFFYFLGFSLLVPSPWLTVIYVLMFWVYYERIFAVEEDFLREKFGEQYLAWANRTPAFIPNFISWVPAERRINMRMILRRETSPWLGVAIGFLGIEAVGDWFSRGTVDVDLLWISLVAFTATVYVVVKVIKKTTTLLDGRDGRVEDVTPAQAGSPAV